MLDWPARAPRITRRTGTGQGNAGRSLDTSDCLRPLPRQYLSFGVRAFGLAPQRLAFLPDLADQKVPSDEQSREGEQPAEHAPRALLMLIFDLIKHSLAPRSTDYEAI